MTSPQTSLFDFHRVGDIEVARIPVHGQRLRPRQQTFPATVRGEAWDAQTQQQEQAGLRHVACRQGIEYSSSTCSIRFDSSPEGSSVTLRINPTPRA